MNGKIRNNKTQKDTEKTEIIVITNYTSDISKIYSFCGTCEA